MSITLEQLHKDLLSLKKDIKHIKSRIDEDFELSNESKKALKEARATPESEYIDLE